MRPFSAFACEVLNICQGCVDDHLLCLIYLVYLINLINLVNLVNLIYLVYLVYLVYNIYLIYDVYNIYNVFKQLSSSTSTVFVGSVSVPSVPSPTATSVSHTSFLQNKVASGFIFTVAIFSLVFVILITTFVVRRRRNRRLIEGAISIDPAIINHDNWENAKQSRRVRHGNHEMKTCLSLPQSGGSPPHTTTQSYSVPPASLTPPPGETLCLHDHTTSQILQIIELFLSLKREGLTELANVKLFHGLLNSNSVPCEQMISFDSQIKSSINVFFLYHGWETKSDMLCHDFAKLIANSGLLSQSSAAHGES